MVDREALASEPFVPEPLAALSTLGVPVLLSGIPAPGDVPTATGVDTAEWAPGGTSGPATELDVGAVVALGGGAPTAGMVLTASAPGAAGFATPPNPPPLFNAEAVLPPNGALSPVANLLIKWEPALPSDSATLTLPPDPVNGDRIGLQCQGSAFGLCTIGGGAIQSPEVFDFPTPLTLRMPNCVLIWQYDAALGGWILESCSRDLRVPFHNGVSAVASPYTASPGELVQVALAFGAGSILLPATPRTNQRVAIKDTSDSINVVTIDGNGALIDGAATRVAYGSQPFGFQQMYFDGSQWRTEIRTLGYV